MILLRSLFNLNILSAYLKYSWIWLLTFLNVPLFYLCGQFIGLLYFSVFGEFILNREGVSAIFASLLMASLSIFISNLVLEHRKNVSKLQKLLYFTSAYVIYALINFITLLCYISFFNIHIDWFLSLIYGSFLLIKKLFNVKF